MTKQLDFIADLFQLSLTYQGSSLSRDPDSSTGTRAGNRAPDAPCLRATSGEPVRLFDLFRGTHFTLLAFGEMLLSVWTDTLRWTQARGKRMASES